MSLESMENAVGTLRDAKVAAFDWDGTLIDTVPGKLRQNQALAREFGNVLTEDEVREIWNASAGFVELMQELCQTDDMDAIMQVVKRDYDKLEYAKQSFDFAPEFLQLIERANKRAALVTSVTRELLTIDAESVGIDLVQFAYSQASDESDMKKPDPRVFDAMLAQLDVKPHQVVYIGDEQKDIDAARGAGMEFIGVETGMLTSDEFEKSGVASVRNLGELACQYGTRYGR